MQEQQIIRNFIECFFQLQLSDRIEVCLTLVELLKRNKRSSSGPNSETFAKIPFPFICSKKLSALIDDTLT